MRPIYIDSHATTPLDEKVLQEMIPYFTEKFGNPASINHSYGWEAESAVKKARSTLAEAINCEPDEIIFTSGATESNNLAIKGVAESYFNKGRHIITVKTEHRSILDPCQYLEKLGFQITYLPVQSNGLIDINELEKNLLPETILVSIMTANNEIGVLQPIAEIGQLCHDNNIIFHTDSAQAIGKIPLNVQSMNIDLMSLTAHKNYGPKGIGALYVRRRNPRVKLASQIQGGGQERGFRSGTLYTPQIVGFGCSVALAIQEMTPNNQQLKMMRNRLWKTLDQELDEIYLNGDLEQRLSGNLNVSFAGVDGSALLLALQPFIALSSGSACTSTHITPSHVLMALGRSEKLAYGSLRFGLSKFNTVEEIDFIAEKVITSVKALRRANSQFSH